MNITKFSEKLNKLNGNIYTIEEVVNPVDGIYEADLEHDNIDTNTINIYTGSKLTGDKINTYTISAPSLTPWRTHITIYSNEPTLYITYETVGDTIEADDINKLQREINKIQKNMTTLDNKQNNIFNTVSDMIKQTHLKEGDCVETLGYYKKFDKGGARYVVETTKYDWSIKLSNGYYANIHEPDNVNYRQFGAYLNGKDDDGKAMVLCHSYADSIYHLDINGYNKIYTCTVKNNEGIIYKKNQDAINCVSDVDLSGSTLLIDDTNATWYGIYLWGDIPQLYWTYEITEETKATFKADNYMIETPSNDTLPPYTVLNISETPYAVRDDGGYLYSVPRKELLIHGLNGICTSPFADDWTESGGAEINCRITNLTTGLDENAQAFSELDASYTYIPSKQGKFIGCEVKMEMSANKYSTVLTVKRHNCIIKDFLFKVNPLKLHNTSYNNSMIYVMDSYNVTIQNIQGFNKSGQATDSQVATSGYMLRMTNCSDVNVEDCNMTGYWGCNAMDSVKNIHFKRCHMNRLDVHDYFYNLYATECVFYHHAIQLGYGRGVAMFNNCTFYYNDVPLNSYPEAYAIAFNLTYGRIFEGLLTLENCNIHLQDVPNNEYSLFEMFFSDDATSVTRHFNFPEVRCRNLNIKSQNKDISFSYFKIGGQRNARTGVEAPTRVYGVVNDNDIKWEYIGRAFDYGKLDGRELHAKVGDILRVFDKQLNSEGKTNFYNYKYYKCTKEGDMVYSSDTPTAADITLGTAMFTRIDDISWQSNYSYNVGDVILVSKSNFYSPYIYKCIKAGTSNGYRPIHTTGTVIDGINDSVKEQDSCWWKYVTKKDSWCVDFSTMTSYSAGTRFIAEDRIYEVVTDITSTNYPPFETGWFKESSYGGGIIKYIGNVWKPKKWYAVSSYCESEGNIYELEKHNGVTSGILPTIGSKYCIDGDIIWEAITDDKPVTKYSYVNWEENFHYNVGEIVISNQKIYEVQPCKTGNSLPTVNNIGDVYMDGTIPVQYLGTFAREWRVAGNSYNVGDIIFDNTFAVICIQSGKTDSSSQWGCLESASGWRADDTYIDGDCIWKKLTQTSSNGVWRNSSKAYDVGTVLLEDDGANNNMVFVVQETKTGYNAPTSTDSNVFINGTTAFLYKGEFTGTLSWTKNTRYNIGDVISVDNRKYKCVFDGRLTLPRNTIFENISTNITNGYVFAFVDNVDVPVKNNDTNWKIILNNCDNIVDVETGLSNKNNFFGGNNYINPTVKTDN